MKQRHWIVDSLIVFLFGGGLVAYLAYFRDSPTRVTKGPANEPIAASSAATGSPAASSPALSVSTTYAAPRQLRLNVDQFLHRLWADQIQSAEYLGFRVSWEVLVSGLDPDAGPNMLRVQDDKLLVALPGGDSTLAARLQRLESGDLIRVEGVLQLRTNGSSGEPVVVATDFELLRHDEVR